MKRNQLLAHLKKKVGSGDIEFLREDPSRSYLLAKAKVGKQIIKISLKADGSLIVRLIADEGTVTETHQFQVFEILSK